MPRVSYRAAAAAGDGWAMVPSAAAFIDPLFSTGIPMTLLGIERLARGLESGYPACLKTRLYDVPVDRRGGESLDSLGAYSATTLREADHTARFVAGCYAAFPRFDVFAAYSMFYFVAASFSEMARRLTPAQPGRGFLFAADPDMAPAIARMSPAAQMPTNVASYAREIAAVCDGFNIAGLCDPTKRNSYGVDLEDTVRGAAKLGLSPERVREGLSLMLNV